MADVAAFGFQRIKISLPGVAGGTAGMYVVLNDDAYPYDFTVYDQADSSVMGTFQMLVSPGSVPAVVAAIAGALIPIVGLFGGAVALEYEGTDNLVRYVPTSWTP